MFTPFGPFSADPGTGSADYTHPVANNSVKSCSCALVGGDESLHYQGSTVNPQPIVEVDDLPDTSILGVPTSLVATLTWNAVNQPAVTFTTTGHSHGDHYLYDLQVNSAVTVTNFYTWSVTRNANWTGQPSEVDFTDQYTTPVVVSPSSGPMGAGWSIGSVDKLVPAGTGNVIWIHGSGGFRVFTGGSLGTFFVSPSNEFGKLHWNDDGTYTYYAKDQLTTANFDSSGRITSVVDPHSLTRTYTYNASGLISTITEMDGTVTTYSYNVSNQLTKIVEPGPRTVTLSYTGSTLTGIQDPDGSLETFSYDGSGRLTNDQRGPVNATISYDATSHEVSSMVLGGTTTMTVAPTNAVALSGNALFLSNQVGVLSDGLTQATTYVQDTLDRVTQFTTADAAITTYALNTAGLATVMTDGLGHQTQYTYGAKGTVIQINFPDGSINTFAYARPRRMMPQPATC
jgi:YD repeat-containing protein